jgi:hypothetical protein
VGTEQPKKAEAPAPKRPNVFYVITLTLSLIIASTPFILAGIAGGGLPPISMMDAVGAVTAGVLFWTATMLGLVKSIRIFGCMVGGAVAAGIGTPLAAMILFNKSSGQTPASWVAMATYALIFAGAALVLWFVLGAISGKIDGWIKKHRAALALDFFLGSAFGLALIMGLSIVYSITHPDWGYTHFWKSKAEEVKQKADELRK